MTETAWPTFQERFAKEHLSGLSKYYAASWYSAMKHFDKQIAPQYVDDVDAAAISRYVAYLRQQELSETMIVSYLKHIFASLNWARRMGYLAEVPEYATKSKARHNPGMRSRPPTGEEFDRMLSSIEQALTIMRRGSKKKPGVTVVPEPEVAATMRFYLRGLWWSGLRLGESLRLSWDWGKPFSVMLDTKYPCYHILASAHKSRKDTLLPIAPEFVELLRREVPEKQRRGRVFRIPFSDASVGSKVSEIGKAAKIIVNGDGKYASAHDLRRAFGTRWSQLLQPAELKELMRHRNIETTMSYYVHISADNLGAKLWHANALGGETGGKPDSSTPTQVVKDHKTP